MRTQSLRRITAAAFLVSLLLTACRRSEPAAAKPSAPDSVRQPVAEAVKSPDAGVPASAAAEPAIIAKARAYIGSEQLLDSVQSIHFSGTLTYEDGTKGVIDLILQKPCRQRIVITTEKAVETSALDEYDAWTRIQDSKDLTRWKLTLLNPLQIKMFRANTLEQFNFFRSPGKRDVMIEDLGDVAVDGIKCRKVAFKRDDGNVFVRYFDVDTGRLVLIETPQQGGKVREEGEIMAGGLRFPKRHVQSSKFANGKFQTVTIEFDQAAVNEVFPRSIFAVPSISNR